MGQVNENYQRSMGIYYHLTQSKIDGLSQKDLSLISVALDNLLDKTQKPISEAETKRVYQVLQSNALSNAKIGSFQEFINRISNFFHTRLSSRTILEKKDMIDKNLKAVEKNLTVADSRLLEIAQEQIHLNEDLKNLTSQNEEIDNTKYSYLVMSRDLGNTPKGFEVLNAIKAKIKSNSDITPNDRLIILIESFDDSSMNLVTRYIGELINKLEIKRERVLKETRIVEKKLKNLDQEKLEIETKVKLNQPVLDILKNAREEVLTDAMKTQKQVKNELAVLDKKNEELQAEKNILEGLLKQNKSGNSQEALQNIIRNQKREKTVKDREILISNLSKEKIQSYIQDRIARILQEQVQIQVSRLEIERNLKPNLRP